MMRYSVSGRDNRRWGLTENPTSLNKGNIWIVHEEGDSSEKKIWFWLVISIKQGDIFTLLGIVPLHSFLQGSRFEPFVANSGGIFDIYAFACPILTFLLHQILDHQISHRQFACVLILPSFTGILIIFLLFFDKKNCFGWVKFINCHWIINTYLKQMHKLSLETNVYIFFFLFQEGRHIKGTRMNRDREWKLLLSL